MSEGKKVKFEDLEPEVQQILANLASMGEGSVSPTEFQEMMGQIHYFLKDNVTESIMMHDPRLFPLLPGVSPLIRTSRQDDPRIRAQMKLRWRRAVEMQLLVLPKEIKWSDLALADSLIMFGFSAIDDQREGWRGKLAAERTRTYKMEGAVPRKKGWLERLGLR